MRDRILKLLLQNSDEYVSGEKIAQHVGISRAAVWKHVDMLKRLGCEVESKPNRGYRMTFLPDSLAPEIIRAVDVANTTEGHELKYYEQVGSTNDAAMELAMQGAKHGTIVLAEEQTKGKGRQARAWYAPKGEGIYMSIILRPELAPQDAPKISLIAGIAVAQTIKAQAGIQVGVKWPNDVLSGARKLCGILTEMTADPDRIHHVVCGIGINVNQQSFPNELQQVATSMRIQGGGEYARAQVAAQVIGEFFRIYDEYTQTGDTAPIITEYTRMSVLQNQFVEVRAGNVAERGRCIGFDKDGAIVLELPNGRRRRFVGGEASVRSENIYV